MHSNHEIHIPEDRQIRELTSGVDALYLSGQAALPPALIAVLEHHRLEAEEADSPVPFNVAGDQWWIEPRSLGRYRYRLVHPHGRIGITPSKSLPAFTVQPNAEFLHGVGPPAVLKYFQQAGEWLTAGPVEWKLSRIDLFCDVQGWNLSGDDRSRFGCRADRRTLHEADGTFTGFEFGSRSTKTLSCRIYDKTLQVSKKGLDWWPKIWGSKFDRTRQVLRIEFEIGRQGLKEFGIDRPEDGLRLVHELWASATSKWLTYRDPTSDETRSRWPIAAEWVDIQNASLRGDAVGIDRIRKARQKGELRLLVPAFVGYAARIAALSGADDLYSALGASRHLILADQQRRGILFEERIADKVAEEARR